MDTFYSSKMLDRIKNMAQRTWNAIGPDVLNSYEPMLTRDQVVEIVADADHMLIYGNDKEAFDFWKSIKTREKRREILNKAFDNDYYSY